MHSSGRHPLFLRMILSTDRLRLLSAGVDLHEHVQRVSALSQLAGGVQLLRKLDAVDALDHPEVRDLANELVALPALQVADQVPPDILGQHFGLVHELLDVVLAEIAVSVVVQLLDVLCGLLLAHRDNSRLLLRPLPRPVQPLCSAG